MISQCNLYGWQLWHPPWLRLKCANRKTASNGRKVGPLRHVQELCDADCWRTGNWSTLISRTSWVHSESLVEQDDTIGKSILGTLGFHKVQPSLEDWWSDAYWLRQVFIKTDNLRITRCDWIVGKPRNMWRYSNAYYISSLKRIYTDRVSKLCFKDPFHVATGW